MSNFDLSINVRKPAGSADSCPPGSSHLLHIEKLVAGGFGLGRLDGQVVLCEGDFLGNPFR